MLRSAADGLVPAARSSVSPGLERSPCDSSSAQLVRQQCGWLVRCTAASGRSHQTGASLAPLREHLRRRCSSTLLDRVSRVAPATRCEAGSDALFGCPGQPCSDLVAAAFQDALSAPAAGLLPCVSAMHESGLLGDAFRPAAPCCIASLEVRVSMLPEARITSSVPTAIEGNALPAIADPRAGHWTVFPTRLAMLLRQRAVHAPGHRSRRALSILLAAREDRLCRYVQASREDRSRSTSKLARRAGLDASSSHQQQCWWHRLSGRCGPCFRKGLRWGPVSVLDGPLELRRAIPYQACWSPRSAVPGTRSKRAPQSLSRESIEGLLPITFAPPRPRSLVSFRCCFPAGLGWWQQPSRSVRARPCCEIAAARPYWFTLRSQARASEPFWFLRRPALGWSSAGFGAAWRPSRMGADPACGPVPAARSWTIWSTV